MVLWAATAPITVLTKFADFLSHTTVPAFPNVHCTHTGTVQCTLYSPGQMRNITMWVLQQAIARSSWPSWPDVNLHLVEAFLGRLLIASIFEPGFLCIRHTLVTPKQQRITETWGLLWSSKIQWKIFSMFEDTGSAVYLEYSTCTTISCSLCKDSVGQPLELCCITVFTNNTLLIYSPFSLKGQCHEKSCSPEALGRWVWP